MQDIYESELLSALQNLSEYDLTLQLIKPLLLALGYERVEYFGGPDEEGKDVICWKTDHIGDEELAVVQVKKYKPTKRAADKYSFSEIVNQLTTAAEKELPNVNGVAYPPRDIYLITPFAVDTKVLRSRFEGYRQLRNTKIIDGPRLAKLLRSYVPEITRQICGSSLEVVRTVVMPHLINNDVLMKALDAKTGRDLRTFYTDLDLAMGRLPNQLIFLAEFEPQSCPFAMLENEWSDLKSTLGSIRHEFLVNPLSRHSAEIEKRYLELQERAAIQKDTLRDLDAAIAAAGDELGMAEEELRIERERIRSIDPSIAALEGERAKLQAQLLELWKLRPPHATEKIEQIYQNGTAGDHEPFIVRKPMTPEEKQASRLIEAVDRKLRKRLSSLRPLDTRVAAFMNERRKLSDKRARLTKRVITPLFEGELNGFSLAEGLRSKRHEILAEIETYNLDPPTPSRLRDFFVRSEGTFRIAARLLQLPALRDSLRMRLREDLHGFAGVRLKISLARIFETRLNMVLLGDAGAGKTTSLQNYAATKLESARPGELVLFAPLSRVLEHWRREEPDLDSKPAKRLELGVRFYLKGLGLTIDPVELKALFGAGGSVLLLDAVDEVVKSAPWISVAIKSLANRFAKLQVITSSRSSSPGIDGLGFTTLTLLPFTNSQRERFVRAWFRATPIDATAILNHVAKKRELNEIVRNPLLATILCVLKEHRIPLPDNERTLYEERLRLLVGDYDIQKQVHRITSQRRLLKLAAQKLAFRLHYEGRRDATREEMYEWVTKILEGHVSNTGSKKLIDELVDPCNVLCSMTEDGRLGFGHLRYQEYLVAVELLENRAFDLVAVTRQPWWRGVLVLLAQISTSIDWLIRDMIAIGMLTAARDVVMAMIKVRPLGERGGLRSLVAANMTIDGSSRGAREFAEEFFGSHFYELEEEGFFSPNPDDEVQ
jgi:uncharacterized coiled-coil protein SlyX